jgi:hypothetical protein
MSFVGGGGRHSRQSSIERLEYTKSGSLRIHRPGEGEGGGGGEDSPVRPIGSATPKRRNGRWRKTCKILKSAVRAFGGNGGAADNDVDDGGLEGIRWGCTS